jgi:DNA-binding IclR family transcriptional regulator
LAGSPNLPRKVERGPRSQSDRPLERYLRILEITAGFSGGISLSRFAEILDLPKTTVHRLVRNLVETGILVTDVNGRYRLGQRFARLAYAGTPDEWINSMSYTFLKDLAEETGQACFIAKLTDNKIRSVAMVAPDNLARGYVVPGRELWPHAAASAKAILAFQSDAVVKAVLPSPLPRLTDRTKTRLKDLQAELDSVRTRELGLCVGEDVEGFAGIACPILRPGFDVLYSVGITGTIETLINRGVAQFEKRLRACAVQLSRAIEARSPDQPRSRMQRIPTGAAARRG